MKASYDGSAHIAKALLNAGAKTDLQDKVLFGHWIWDVLEKSTNMICEMYHKAMVLLFGLFSTFISIVSTLPI